MNTEIRDTIKNRELEFPFRSVWNLYWPLQKTPILGDPGVVKAVGSGERARRKFSSTPVLENFRPAFSPDPTDRPWVSEDGKHHNILVIILFVGHSAKILHKHCLQFLLGVKWPQEKLKNSAYAKLWRSDQQNSIMVCYGIFWSGQ